MPAVRIAALLIALTLLCSIVPHAPRIRSPKLVLWAWERPEDLRFIDPLTTGVAFLAATVAIHSNGSLAVAPRLQPLKLSPDISPIAVVRIETSPHYVVPNIASLVDLLRTLAEHASALQIDYDARNSERPFYRSLLAALRVATSKPIEITALVSWCAGDRWLANEPISEAIPMFFRMGRNEYREIPIEAPVCNSSIGVSVDEPWPSPKPGKRIYVFNPRPWTVESYAAVVRQAQEWQ